MAKSAEHDSPTLKSGGRPTRLPVDARMTSPGGSETATVADHDRVLAYPKASISG